MIAIIMEGVLFVALVAACGALLFFVISTYTPVGRRMREVRNRRLIEKSVETHCPIHGQFKEDDVVRLDSGDRVCPHCFKETVWQTR
jgi:transcription antitermination factor NusG